MACGKTTVMLAAIAFVLAACGGGSANGGNTGGIAPPPVPVATSTPTPAPSPQGGQWRLVWSDEFAAENVDPTRWNLIEDCWGGGNEERQCYTPRRQNVAIENGHLVLTARQEQWTGSALPVDLNAPVDSPSPQTTKSFTSGKLTTQGKFSRRYGRIEMRARLPQGQGVWPAFWMMPEDNVYGRWAASGEIDILETVNLGVVCAQCPAGGENRIYGSLHYGGPWPGNVFSNRNRQAPQLLDGGFHVFGVIWEEGRFTWTLDGEPYGSKTASEWFTSASSNPNAPFDEEFHLIINLAIGGRWPENEGLGGVSTANFPKRMEIDWIRVYQCDAQPTTGKGCSQGN